MLSTASSLSTNVAAGVMAVALIFYLVVMLAAAIVSFFGGIAKGFLLVKYPEREEKSVKYSLQ